MCMTVTSPKDIPVYPDFAHYHRKLNIADGPWLCEDDDGTIAFVSKEMKRQFLKRTWHEMNGHRRK